MNSGRAHALRVLFVAIVLAVAWQAGALIVQSSGGPAMRLAPTWQQIILVDLPGMAAFQYGGQESDYGAALWVLATNALATIARVLTSLVLAFILGTALGVITMSNRFARGVLSPIARTARNVPLLALVPLFLIWFGGEEYGVIAFITFGLSGDLPYVHHRSDRNRRSRPHQLRPRARRETSGGRLGCHPAIDRPQFAGGDGGRGGRRVRRDSEVSFWRRRTVSVGC